MLFSWYETTTAIIIWWIIKKLKIETSTKNKVNIIGLNK